jgi:hypothetical protein
MKQKVRDGVPEDYVTPSGVPIHFVTKEEGREIFDEAARFYLGISAEEFEEKYAAGLLDPDEPRVMEVLFASGLAR